MSLGFVNDLLDRAFKQRRRVTNFFYLCWAPFGVRPSNFRSESGQCSPYQGLGWRVPLTPALIYAFAVKLMMRPVVDLLKSGPEGNAAADVVRQLADWLPEAGSVVAFFMIVYVGAFGSWMFNGIICYMFRRAGQPARNAPFEFYLIRWAGVWTLFALTMVAMFIPAFAQYDEGWRRDVATWIAGYPFLMLGLLGGFAALWWAANAPGIKMKPMSEVYCSRKQ